MVKNTFRIQLPCAHAAAWMPSTMFHQREDGLDVPPPCGWFSPAAPDQIRKPAQLIMPSAPSCRRISAYRRTHPIVRFYVDGSEQQVAVETLNAIQCPPHSKSTSGMMPMLVSFCPFARFGLLSSA
jgi:hypothetical protein